MIDHQLSVAAQDRAGGIAHQNRIPPGIRIPNPGQQLGVVGAHGQRIRCVVIPLVGERQVARRAHRKSGVRAEVDHLAFRL